VKEAADAAAALAPGPALPKRAPLLRLMRREMRAMAEKSPRHPPSHVREAAAAAIALLHPPPHKAVDAAAALVSEPVRREAPSNLLSKRTSGLRQFHHPLQSGGTAAGPDPLPPERGGNPSLLVRAATPVWEPVYRPSGALA
jgi:hypothetical protein